MLKLTIFIAALVSSALGAALSEGLLPQLEGRIVGGNVVNISNYPWQVSVQRSGSHFCGGSIYSDIIIVTAAHCLQSVSTNVLKVRAGSSYWNNGGQLVGVHSFRRHEEYNPRTKINDIAVIRLSSPLSMGPNVKLITLATSIPAADALAGVTGWGSTAYGSVSLSTQLQYVTVKIITQAACASATYGYGENVQRTMLCAAAKDKDACQGDSGGPLVSGGYLVGVVSWGYGCAEPKYPGVYASVANLRSWIVDAANITYVS